MSSSDYRMLKRIVDSPEQLTSVLKSKIPEDGKPVSGIGIIVDKQGQGTGVVVSSCGELDKGPAGDVQKIGIAGANLIAAAIAVSERPGMVTGEPKAEQVGNKFCITTPLQKGPPI